jgi:hypothetical protein
MDRLTGMAGLFQLQSEEFSAGTGDALESMLQRRTIMDLPQVPVDVNSSVRVEPEEVQVVGGVVQHNHGNIITDDGRPHSSRR